MTDEDRLLGLFRKLAQELKSEPAAEVSAEELRAAESDDTRRVGPYLLLDELGSGGGGRVVRAWHPELRRHAAIKLLLADRSGARERLIREAQVAAQLSHPCIVTVYDVGEHKGSPYIAMEFVDGPTLGQVRMTPREALEFMRVIAEAVHFAHERGVIHRDLKPANILLGSDGRPRITDFGLARLQAAGSTITAPGTPAGTPAFMAPEAAKGRPATVRTDVYGLGATLYALLTGEAPFEGASLPEIMGRIGVEDPIPVASRGVRLHRDIATIVETAMAREPRDRYASARAFADDIGRYLEGRPILARPASAVRRAISALRRHRAISVLAALVLLMGAGSAAMFWRGRRHEAETDQRRQRDRRVAAIVDAASAMLHRAEEAQYVEGGSIGTVIDLADRAAASLEEAFALDPGHPAAHSQAGRARELAGRFDQALGHYRKALEAEPSLYSARLARGLLSLRRHRDAVKFGAAFGSAEALRRQALEDMEAATKCGGAGWELDFALAAIAFAEGRLEEAIRRVDGTLVEGPAAAEFHHLAALALHAAGRHREAVARCQQALAIRPGDARVLAVRAGCRFDLREFSEASDDFARALRYDPTRARHWNMLAITAHYGGRDPATVDAAFEAALKLEPGFVEAYSNRALVRTERGDLDRALEDMSAAIRISPGRLELYANRCAMYQRQKRYDEALADAEILVARFPESPLAWSTRARVHTLRKNYEASAPDLDRALQLDPGFGDALIAKANHLIREQRWKEAIPFAERALDTDTSGQALGARGTARWHLGDRQGAVEDFRASAKLNPLLRDAYKIFLED